MQKSGEVGNQERGSEKQSSLQERQGTFELLPLTLSERLLSLMEKVTEEEITPATVNAACNCASEINKLLSLSLRS